MKRHAANFAPEVSPESRVYGGGQGQMISMAGAPKNILPYSSKDHASKPGAMGSEGLKKAAAIAGAVWFLGVFLGYEWAWPLYLVLDVLQSVLSTPPFSWLFGWVLTPLSWLFSWFYRGAPLVDQVGALQELRLPADQVSAYVDAYAQQYGDAALIFATHGGYPQIVNALLLNRDLGMRDLVDAADDSGNTALIYAASKGFRQCTATLLRNNADPDVANQGNGGRTPLMEAAGGGHRDIVSAIRLSKASIDATDDFGNTALHYAAYHGHLAVVQELLKGNPSKDLKNSYGHTPASYAASNKHKGIADLINRYRPKAGKEEPGDRDLGGNLEALTKKKEASSHEDLTKTLEAIMKKAKEEKHVKGSAEDLHKAEKNFAPKLEKLVSGISDSEKKSLEDQVAKLRRQHEEAELKAQKRIVELLEKSSSQQKAVDDAERQARAAQLNSTELSLRVQELESKHQATELRASDEKQRADRLQDDIQRTQLEMDRHRSRADGAERERDLHAEASRRHEDNLRRKHEEVNEHLSRIERQTRDISAMRDDLRRREDELWQHRETIAALERELKLARGDASPPAPAPPPPSSAPPPPPPPPATEAPAPAPQPPALAPEASAEAPAAAPPMASDAAPAAGAAAGEAEAAAPAGDAEAKP